MSLDRILTAAAVLVAAVVGAVAVQAQQRSTADSFRAKFLAALADHRRHDVAAMFTYPARVIVSGFPIPVQDEAALIRMYDLFFTREMRCLLERGPNRDVGSTANPDATAAAVLVLADGHIIAERTPAGYKVTRMTVIGQPGATAKEKDAVRADMRLGGQWQRAGRLEGDDLDTYRVSLTTGTQVRLVLQGFRGLDAALRVTDAANHPLTGADARRAWNGTVPASGDYRVEVFRRAAYCGAPINYVLTIAVR
jgi:hypothetical protein